MMNDLIQRQNDQRRFTSLEQEAQSWLPQWKELSRYIRPTRGFFRGTNPNWGSSPDYKALIDGTSARAARILAAGMTSGLTSPSRPWFKLGLADQDLASYSPVKLWLDTVQDRMMGVFSKSNIYTVLHSLYEEIGVFGSAATLLLDDYDQIVRGRSFTAGEYFLGTGSDGRVNTFARRSWFTVSQLVSEFGYENCSVGVRNMYDTHNYDKWVKVCQLIEPNPKHDDSKLTQEHMAFCSKYWEEGSADTTYLRVDGFQEFPVLAPRWDLTTTADSYGKGPGWDALGDIRMLQKMQKDKLLALDKLVDPPMQSDSSVDVINTLPGGVSRSNSTVPNAGIRPAYQIQPDLAAIERSIQSTQSGIEKYFYTDLFLMLANADRSQMTAKEVAVRQEEKLLMLGPVIERLESELTDPLIDRTFGILMRLSQHNPIDPIIPPPPQELQGQHIKVDYVSILAQAQKMVGSTSLQRTAQFVGNLAGANKDVLDVIDFDEMAIEFGETEGVSPRVIRSKDEIAKIRQQRAQQMQAQQAQQNAMAAVQGAKVLSDTPIGQGSALDRLLGTEGEGR